MLRRKVLQGLLFTPFIIRTPNILMPIKKIYIDNSEISHIDNPLIISHGSKPGALYFDLNNRFLHIQTFYEWEKIP